MSLTKETIELIKQATDIEEVIGDFVSLKRKGHYLMACCPFHHEKTPSFTVTPGKGIYKCFGCGKAGDSIQFLMDIEALNYIEALRYLASKYGIEIKETAPTEEERKQETERDSLFIALKFAGKYYQELLWEHEDGKAIGLSYFKERGFSNETIRTFELGYSLESWDAFTQNALKNQFQTEMLKKAGLTLEGEEKSQHKFFDRFRGRVMFPIHNLAGKIIGFGARILKQDKKQAKYLNSPESEVYHKSKVLYGLYQAKLAIRNEDNCLLVEGYTDVISLHQGGIENVVASSGTSLTVDQIKLIKRYTDNITILYDGDAAGLKASTRGVDMILEEGLDVRIVIFPEGEDPDSYIRKTGGDAFKEYIHKHARDFITFKTELSLKESGGDPLKKAEVIREIVNSIAKIPDSIKRAVLFRQCSGMLEIDEGILISEFNKIQLKSNQKQKEEEIPFFPEAAFDQEITEELNKKESSSDKSTSNQEKEILRLLLRYGRELIEDVEFAKYILNEIEDTSFSDPLFEEMLSLIRTEVSEKGWFDYEIFVRHPNEKIRSMAVDLITDIYIPSHNWQRHEIFIVPEKENLSTSAFKALILLKFKGIQQLIRQNLEELQKTEKEGGDVEEALKIHMQLKQIEKELAVMLGNVIPKRLFINR